MYNNMFNRKTWRLLEEDITRFIDNSDGLDLLITRALRHWKSEGRSKNIRVTEFLIMALSTNEARDVEDAFFSAPSRQSIRRKELTDFFPEEND